ncbi:MAG TPA: hypothetical protein VNP98_05005 [Chthoniobacterales bacterium]|nr:hypothetical protein [Chthoniobacterales bacterium]
MTRRIPCLAAGVALMAAICLSAADLCAQSALSGAAVPIEMVAVVANGAEKRVNSFDGVMDFVALPAGEHIALTLVASSNKAGQPVGVAPLDGGEVIAPPALSVANDGTVGFTFRAGRTRGLYRVLVTLGAHQYELQLYAVAPPGVP